MFVSSLLTDSAWNSSSTWVSLGSTTPESVGPIASSVSLSSTGVASIDVTALVQYYIDNPGTVTGFVLYGTETTQLFANSTGVGSTPPALVVTH